MITLDCEAFLQFTDRWRHSHRVHSSPDQAFKYSGVFGVFFGKPYFAGVIYYVTAQHHTADSLLNFTVVSQCYVTLFLIVLRMD